MPPDPRDYVSPHFVWKEFACHDWLHTPYPNDWRDTRGVDLATELEALRERLSWHKGRDVPLYLNSVYRTPAWNRAVNGRPRSQHLEGMAADVTCPFGCTFDEFAQAVRDTANRPSSRIRYVKLYRHQGFAHLDIRHVEALAIEEDA